MPIQPVIECIVQDSLKLKFDEEDMDELKQSLVFFYLFPLWFRRLEYFIKYLDKKIILKVKKKSFYDIILNLI